MVKLSAFADEISGDLNEQLDVLEEEGIKYIELRGVWEKNVLKFTDDEVSKIKEEISKRGVKISAIGSPLGKVPITNDFEPHLQDLKRIIEIAKELDTSYVRIFSFFMPEGQDPSGYRDEVMRRLGVMVDLAMDADLILLHENESKIYGDTAERCLDIFKTVESPGLRATFDPANFVHCGVDVWEDAYVKLEDYIEYIHVKDYSKEHGRSVPAGEGDGDFKKILGALAQRGFSGFMSLEPHLSFAGGFYGFTGPEGFKVASRALKGLLDELGIEYM